METRIVLSEFKTASIGKFNELSQGLLTAMTGNVYFPTPSPTLVVFEAAIQNLVDKTAFALSGDRTRINQRNDQREVVQELIYQMANYILLEANGNVTEIESTTLKVSKTPERRGIPAPVIGLQVSAPGTPGSGKANLKWKSQKGVTYVVEATMGDPAMPQTEWHPRGVCTKSAFTVEDLNTNVYWSFRVICVNPAGMSEPSVAVTTIVA